jgi:hypothetical protein
MKRLIVTIAALAVLSGSAAALEHISGQHPHVMSGQTSRIDIELAMGPTSAPHLPGGPISQGADSSHAGCSSPYTTCPTPHKKSKHRRRHSSRS